MVSRGILGNEVEISSERIGVSTLESFANLLGQTLTSQVVFYPYGIQNVGSSVTNRNSKLTTEFKIDYDFWLSTIYQTYFFYT